MLSMPIRRTIVALGVAMFALTVAPSARAVPAQIAVFLNSTQKVLDSGPQLSLFGFFYSRPGVDVLGVYAGPRWTFGSVGVEFKTGVYGGGDNYPVKAILNNQLDLTLKHLSLTSFTDWYPPTQMYTYLSGFFVYGPLYVGAVSDLTRDWSSLPFTTIQGGPSVGLGTKGLYLGVAYIFRNDDTQAVRMTVGITL
jgi:hypothetical protein